ncbi:hypothetical protein EYF80_008530 [Liparis tanakae]|uniref:Uncharacterized protein n=1 Tax=Liparis tanakae TaxID=230148 RepID=A0A4Z2ITM3_9TELE|nr:hypothetical protein EYF80_008530 [Liparis tanakae]
MARAKLGSRLRRLDIADYQNTGLWLGSCAVLTKSQLIDDTYPTKPDAELRLRQDGEVQPLGAGLDVERLLFAPQRAK